MNINNTKNFEENKEADMDFPTNGMKKSFNPYLPSELSHRTSRIEQLRNIKRVGFRTDEEPAFSFNRKGEFYKPKESDMDLHKDLTREYKIHLNRLRRKSSTLKPRSSYLRDDFCMED